MDSCGRRGGRVEERRKKKTQPPSPRFATTASLRGIPAGGDFSPIHDALLVCSMARCHFGLFFGAVGCVRVHAGVHACDVHVGACAPPMDKKTVKIEP